MVDHQLNVELKDISQDLIRTRPELAAVIEHHVHIEYVMSDEEVKVNGKVRWGSCTKKSALDYLLLNETPGEVFPPYTFVCIKCFRWSEENSRHTRVIHDELYHACGRCYREVEEWDFSTKRNLTEIEKYRVAAENKQMAGVPAPPGYFLIRMYKPLWTRFKPEQKLYVAHHELCHVGAEYDDGGATRLFLNPHDIEEFNVCARVYGTGVKNEIRLMAEALDDNKAQLALDFDSRSDRSMVLGGADRSITLQATGS